MRGVIREFREAPAVWGAVLFLLAVVQTTMSAMTVMTANAARAQAVPALRERAAIFRSEMALPLVTTVIVAVLVVLSVVSAAIQQRRRSLALLALHGATPWQLTWRICAQVLCLSVFAAAVSLIISPLLARVLYPTATSQLESAGLVFQAVPISRTLASWALGAILAVAVALVAALLTVRPIGRIPPVEALRSASTPPRTAGRVRGVLAVLAVLAALAAFAVGLATTRPTSMSAMTARLTFSTMTPMFVGCTVGMLLLVVALCLAGPPTLARTVTLWTGVVRLPAASWQVARGQAAARARASSSTVIPLTAGLILLMFFRDLSLIIDAWSRLLPANLRGQFEVPGFARTLALLAPAMLVVLAGVCAGYLIAARGRVLDLALVSVGGADRGQLNRIAALDGLMTVVTALLLALAASTVAAGMFVLAELRSFGVATPVVPWPEWLLVAIALAGLGMLASWLTVRGSLRASPAATIARFTGE